MHCFAARLDISVGYVALSFGHPYVLETFAPWQIYIDLVAIEVELGRILGSEDGMMIGFRL